MNLLNKHFILLFCFLTTFIPTYAQNKGVIDEVIWVVGDEAILLSEVEEERLRAQYEGQQIKGDPYCVIPEQLAIQKLFLHQAELDSIEANESSVSHQVDMRLNYYINQIGSKEKMEEYFRKTSSEIREEMIERINQVRREHSVSELIVNQSLMDAAQECSTHLYTYHHNGFWKCMDTKRDKEKLEAMIESGEAPWIKWEE